MAKRTIDDLLNNLDKFEKAVIEQGPKIAEEMGSSAVALAIRRIQKEGLEGFSYSTKTMLATRDQFNRKSAFEQTEIASILGRGKNGKPVKGGVRNTKGAINQRVVKKRYLWIKFKNAKKAVPVMVIPGGYKEFKALNGIENSFVNLTLTGRMFQNTKVLQANKEGTKFLAIIGAGNTENQKKLMANRERYGDFLRPSQKERPILEEIPVNRIRSLMQSILG